MKTNQKNAQQASKKKPTKEKFDIQKFLKENKFKLEGEPGEQTYNKQIKSFLGTFEIEIDLGKAIYALFLGDVQLKYEPLKPSHLQKLLENIKKLS